MKEKIKLSGVPETMLQTVYARAKESSGRGAIHDAKAEGIIEKLDYDFSLADKDTALRSGVIARTSVLDRMTQAWLASHPGAVVVNIACGLDTRCYRMSGYAHWYNLDLPETMAVREKLLPESGTISQITMSAMEDWGSEISEQNVPVLIVVEGLTMYLSERNMVSMKWQWGLCPGGSGSWIAKSQHIPFETNCSSQYSLTICGNSSIGTSLGRAATNRLASCEFHCFSISSTEFQRVARSAYSGGAFGGSMISV